MYADYNFYLTEYMGSAIPDTDYAGIARAADAYINYITHNRIKADELPEWVLERVKMASCAVADACYRQEGDENNATVASESVGNHSKTYAVAKKSFADREREKLIKAKQYLHGTGLLYGGLR
jgi:hypothetical protein